MADTWGWFGHRSSGEGAEFETATPENTWSMHDGKGGGLDTTFASAPAEWANHAWLRGGQMIMAAEAGSPTTQVFVKVVGVWKAATSYVKVAGIWKLATPAVKVAGTWH